MEGGPPWHRAENHAKLADPDRRQAMKELDDARGGLFGAGYTPEEIKVQLDLQRRARTPRRSRTLYEGYTIGEIAGS